MNIWMIKEALASCAVAGNESAKELLDIVERIQNNEKVTTEEIMQLSDFQKKINNG